MSERIAEDPGPVLSPPPDRRGIDGPSAWLRRWAAATPRRLAVASPTVRLDYAALDARVDAVAGVLVGAGVVAGDRVASSLSLGPAAVVVGLAAQRVGAVSVEIPRDLSSSVRQRALETAASVALFTDRGDAIPRPRGLLLCGVVGAGVDEGADVVVADDGACTGGDVGAGCDVDVDTDDDALVLFTSGTTGAPVGVRLSTRNLASNARAIAAGLGLAADDHALCTLPLSYSFGRSIWHSHLVVGGSVFLDGRFAYPRVVLDALVREGCTSFSGVPMTFEVLRRHGLLPALGRAHLRRVTQAGGRLAPSTVREVRAAIAPTPFVVMYGATEATARLTMLDPAAAAAKEGSIGRPIDGVSLDVVDDEGNSVGVGVVGHIVARGSSIADGYLGDDALSAEVFRDGALHTGDLGFVDHDGFYFLVGRASQMMKIAGHRTSPAEIEDELLRHDDIAEAAVVGVADPLLGEAPVAFVVVRAGASVDDQHLRTFLSSQLAPVKVPRRFVRLPALPRSQNGKVQRGELRRLCSDDGAASSPQPAARPV